MGQTGSCNLGLSFFTWVDYGGKWGLMCWYAPYQSAFSIIEHAWSHVSSRLFAGLYLPPHLEGEEVAPCMQAGICEEHKKDKEALLFDFNLDVLGKILPGKLYN